MPAVFHPSSQLRPCGPVRRVGSALLLCLLGLLLALGASTVFWVMLAAAVVVVTMLGGGGGGGGEGGGEGGGVAPVAHFGFPAEFHLVNEEAGETVGIGERPQVPQPLCCAFLSFCRFLFFFAHVQYFLMHAECSDTPVGNFPVVAENGGARCSSPNSRRSVFFFNARRTHVSGHPQCLAKIIRSVLRRRTAVVQLSHVRVVLMARSLFALVRFSLYTVAEW